MEVNQIYEGNPLTESSLKDSGLYFRMLLYKISQDFPQTSYTNTRGGQSTQLHYLSQSTDPAGQILFHYKWKL